MIRLTPDIRLKLCTDRLLLFGEYKVQGVVLIPESININLAQMGAPLNHDIYPGSSTHREVVYREVLHPDRIRIWKCWFLGREGKTGEKPLGAE